MKPYQVPTLYKGADGIFYVRIQLNGKRLHRSTGARSERAAKKLVPDVLGYATRGKAFSDAAQAYVDAKKGRRARTSKAARHHAKILGEFFTGPVDRITVGDWKKFCADYREAHPGARLFDLRKHFSGIMRHAWQSGMLDSMFHVPPLGEHTDVGKEYSAGDLRRMVEYCFDAPLWKRELGTQILMASLGMRLTEVLAMSWERADFHQRLFRLRAVDTKTGKPGIIYWNDQVYQAMTLRFSEADPICPWVFPHRDDPSRPRASNVRAWKRLQKDLGIDGRWHDLRHTAATRLVRAGWSESAACAYLRMTPKILRRYMHVSDADARGMAQALEMPGVPQMQNVVPLR